MIQYDHIIILNQHCSTWESNIFIYFNNQFGI